MTAQRIRHNVAVYLMMAAFLVLALIGGIAAGMAATHGKPAKADTLPAVGLTVGNGGASGSGTLGSTGGALRIGTGGAGGTGAVGFVTP